MNSSTPIGLAPQTETPQNLTVTANAGKGTERGVTVQVRVGDAEQNSIVLSVEEARALSLAIIAAVNKHEQHAHTQRKQGKSPLTLHPATR